MAACGGACEGARAGVRGRGRSGGVLLRPARRAREPAEEGAGEGGDGSQAARDQGGEPLHEHVQVLDALGVREVGLHDQLEAQLHEGHQVRPARLQEQLGVPRALGQARSHGPRHLGQRGSGRSVAAPQLQEVQHVEAQPCPAVLSGTHGRAALGGGRQSQAAVQHLEQARQALLGAQPRAKHHLQHLDDASPGLHDPQRHAHHLLGLHRPVPRPQRDQGAAANPRHRERGCAFLQLSPTCAGDDALPAARAGLARAVSAAELVRERHVARPPPHQSPPRRHGLLRGRGGLHGRHVERREALRRGEQHGQDALPALRPAHPCPLRIRLAAGPS
mmetsp:Transcript_6344/g.20568  ORF Transcript_6344/g.20568 Transcript_6344/m.20568 type:complete len:333 (-) Transcript_6344:386-1384(-)